MNMANDLRSSSSSSSGIDLICDDGFEDACSICLEPFTSLDPPSITKCKHEYHLQCILEWSQRSNECPICTQSLVLKDPISQELLSGVNSLETFSPQRDLNQGTPSLDDPDFEQRIRQRFAAFTTRARNLTKRTKQTSPSRVVPSVDNSVFSESLKSKISSASTRYKEAISKSTRDFKEKLIVRNDSVKELGKGVQREMNAGITGIAKMIQRLDITQKRG